MATGMSNESLPSQNGAATDSAYDLLTQSMYTAPEWDNEIAGHGILQLFGSWVKTIYNGELGVGEAVNSTLLHDVLITSNYIAMVMFIFLVMYVGWAAIMKTAADGEVLGKNWSPVWLPFRTGLAMALMFPMSIANHDGSDSGVRVSMIQKFTIYLAFVGSELGDIAANVIYDSIDKKPITTPTTDHSLAVKWYNELYANYICHNIAVKYAKDTKFFIKPFDLFSLPLTNHFHFNIGYNSVTDVIAEIRNKQDGFMASNKTAPDMTIYFGGENGSCGTLTIPGRESIYNGGGIETVEYAGDKMKIALKQYRSDLAQTAYAYTLSNIIIIDEMARDAAKKVTDTDISQYRSSFEKNSYNDTLRKLKEEFITDIGMPQDTGASTVNGVLNMFRDVIDGVTPDSLNTIMKMYKKQGWAGLGQLYYMIGAVGEIKPTIVKHYTRPELTTSIVPEAKDLGLEGDGWWSSWFGGSSESTRMKWDEDMANKYTKYLQYARGDASGLGITADGVVNCADNGCKINSKNVADGVKTKLASSFILDHFITGGNYSPTGDTNVFPLARVQETGSTLVMTGVTIFTIKTFLEGALEGSRVALENGVGPASIRGAIWAGIKTLLSTPIMALAMSSTMMIGVGAYMAYVLPMMPTLMWLMMVVSYFVMVIEAFAASPLAVVQMATPEGEGISGTRMERAISILAALTLTPTLNVIGFIASITVMYVAFPLYNSMFFTAWSFLDGSEEGYQSFTNWLPKLIVVIVLYVSGLTMLIRQCYTIMPTIKQHILEWFSSGASRAFGENDSNQKIDSMNDKMGARAGGMESAARQMKATNRQSQQREKGRGDKDENSERTVT